MATRFALIEAEADLTSLARALFEIPSGPAGERILRRVERELLRLNTGLRDTSSFVPGTRVIVPRIPGLKMTDRVDPPQTGIPGLLLDASARLSEAQASIAATVSAIDARREATLAVARNDKILATASEVLPESLKIVETTTEHVRDLEAQTKERAEVYRRAIETARQEIERRLDALSQPDVPRRS